MKTLRAMYLLLLLCAPLGAGCAGAADPASETGSAGTDDPRGRFAGAVADEFGQNVSQPVALDVVVGDFKASVLTEQNGNPTDQSMFNIYTPVSGDGTVTVYYGVLPEHGSAAIEVSAPVRVPSLYSKAHPFVLQLSFESGQPTLQVFANVTILP
jgi:hypothetical protein